MRIAYYASILQLDYLNKIGLTVWTVFVCMLGFSVIQLIYGEKIEILSTESQWYPGINLNDGDFFEYDFCHVDYFECKPLLMEFFVKNQTDDYWNIQVIITEKDNADSKISGNIQLFKDSMKFVSSDTVTDRFSEILDRTFVWLNNFSTLDNPKDTTLGEDWGQIGNIGGGVGLKVISVNDPVLIDSKAVDATVLGWPVSAKTSKVWIVDGFPFPVKAETFVHIGTLPTDYNFQLIEYHAGNQEEKMGNIFILSPPLKQLKSGILPENIMCNDGSKLILKYDDMPACIKRESISKLSERGWISETDEHSLFALKKVLDSCANDSAKDRMENPLRHINGTHAFSNLGCEWKKIGKFVDESK